MPHGHVKSESGQSRGAHADARCERHGKREPRYEAANLPGARRSRLMNGLTAWLCVAWPLGLGFTIFWNSSVLFDATALVRISLLMDAVVASWLTATVGYAGLLATASNLKQHRGASLGPTASIAWSVLAVCCYTLHLFLLRWPWMGGAIEPGSR